MLGSYTFDQTLLVMAFQMLLYWGFGPVSTRILFFSRHQMLFRIITSATILASTYLYPKFLDPGLPDRFLAWMLTIAAFGLAYALDLMGVRIRRAYVTWQLSRLLRLVFSFSKSERREFAEEVKNFREQRKSTS
jgi:hypothetical protein